MARDGESDPAQGIGPDKKTLGKSVSSAGQLFRRRGSQASRRTQGTASGQGEERRLREREEVEVVGKGEESGEEKGCRHGGATASAPGTIETVRRRHRPPGHGRTPGGLRVGVTDVWDRGGLGESWLCRVHETRGMSAVDLLYGRCRGCGSLSFGIGCGTSWPYRHN